MKNQALITVRTSSSRLPQKCLMPFGDRRVIEHIIQRARHYGLDPVVCTSTDPSDDILEKIANQEGARCFRGSLINKLKRWSDCCSHFKIDEFHSVDADDPFFDGDLMKKSLGLLMQGYDMVAPTKSSAAGGASVGFSLKADLIHRASAITRDDDDTEMMWYYLEKMEGLKKIEMPDPDLDPVKVRLTLDYEEDYWLLSSVCRILGHLAPRADVDNLFRRNPDLYKINWFRNEEWKAGQLAKRV